MDTIKIQNPRKPKIIAHRGVSKLETENTLAAFIAAGNRSYFGIETDVHVTADRKLVLHHDDRTGRVADKDLPIEQSRYDNLRALRLKDRDGTYGRIDLKIPNLAEYISICKRYEKTAVLELKNPFKVEDLNRVCDEIERIGWMKNTVFISFSYENLVLIRKRSPAATVQFLCDDNSQEMLNRLAKDHFDIDIYFPKVTRAFVDYAHQKGVSVNCWTVDEPGDAERLIDYGVDFITTNILE